MGHSSGAYFPGPQPHPPGAEVRNNQARPSGYLDNGTQIQNGEEDYDDTDMFDPEQDLDDNFNSFSLENEASNINLTNNNGEGNTGPNRGQFPPMGLDTEAKEAWKQTRKLANKSAENDIFIKFIQACIDKKVVPEMAKLAKRVPTNFCHGSPMTPEPKSQETWDKALKASSLVLLQHTLAMAQSKKRSLSIRMEAQNNMLKALIDNQAKFDEVVGIRKILIDKHTDTQTKRADARLARLIATGSDNPPPPDQNQGQGNPQTPRSANTGQGFQGQRAQGAQGSSTGAPRPPTLTQARGKNKRSRPQTPRGLPQTQPQYQLPGPPYQGPPPMPYGWPMPQWQPPPQWYPPPMGPPPTHPPTQMNSQRPPAPRGRGGRGGGRGGRRGKAPRPPAPRGRQ